VRVEFAWDAPSRRGEVTEADCICPPELAARLVQLLYTGSEETPEAPLAERPLHYAAGACPLI
jgi:hypothetical protein